MKKSKKYTTPEIPPSIVEDTGAMYISFPKSRQPILLPEFTFKSFEKVFSKAPFTIAEWAAMLHISERTLQRYAKNNSAFSGIYTDRILHLEQLIDLGLQVFKSPKALYDWLLKDKVVFNKTLNITSLQSQQGITDTYNQIGRILYNVYS